MIIQRTEGGVLTSNAIITEKKTSLKSADKTKSNNALLNDNNSANSWVDWGENNNRPNDIVNALDKCGVAKSNLGWQAKVFYGGGLITFTEEVDENGRLKVTPVTRNEESEIHDFLNLNKVKRYFLETIIDNYYFGWTVTEVIFSRDYKKITSFRHKETAFTRLSKMNTETRRVESIHYSALWDKGLTDNSEYIEEIAVIDPYMTKEELVSFLKKQKTFKAVYLSIIPRPGKSYYPRPDWQTSFDNGWIDLAVSIPLFKKSMMENQMSIKYHVEIVDTYWSKAYKDWDSKSEKEQEEAKDSTLKLIDEFLTGPKNAGKTFISGFSINEFQKEHAGVKITVLDDKFKEGTYLPDAAAANAEISYSMNVDPTLKGQQVPGANAVVGSGSGSDKRVAFNIYNSLLDPDRDIFFEPIEFIQNYNGWNPEVKFGFKQIQVQTLDVNPTGSQNILQG